MIIVFFNIVKYGFIFYRKEIIGKVMVWIEIWIIYNFEIIILLLLLNLFLENNVIL